LKIAVQLDRSVLRAPKEVPGHGVSLCASTLTVKALNEHRAGRFSISTSLGEPTWADRIMERHVKGAIVAPKPAF